jgi:type I restriction enzyme S subunit
MNSHSAVPGLNRDNVYSILKEIPPLPEQCAIAKILSGLDAKIELNHQMNRTLESIAQAIFKRWFVDFEFPDEHDKPHKSSGGKMVNSELGEIPDGWNAGMLSDILELQIGGDWGEDDNFEGAVQVVSLRGTDLEQLKSCGYAINAPARWIKKDSLEKRRIDDCDILIGGSGLGPIGRSIYCSSEINSLYQYPVTHSNFCKRLSSEIPAYAIYAECILENMYRSEVMKQYFTGTSIPNLDTNSLLSHKIVIPPKTVTTWFYQILKNKYARLYNNENIILSQIRDSLLPRLMSGKIRVLN